MIVIEYEIKGYSKYKITKCGKVISYKGATRRVIKTFINNKGYELVRLYPDKPKDNYRPDCYSVHRLMGVVFLDNPENKPEINHKNSMRTDNRVENLEWCTTSENAIHRIKSQGAA